MAEDVGLRALDTYFQRIHDLLSWDGVALVHFIGRYDRPTQQNVWLTKYIFPGGYTPPLSQAFAAVERSGLICADVEIWRTHYADTLREWRARFLANRAAAEALYDDRFVRMWEFYLAGSEASFRVGENIVAQLLLIRDRDALPQTRDWMP
jgi:cyclopropane-fatty-acyl-phospholipid synthase